MKIDKKYEDNLNKWMELRKEQTGKETSFEEAQEYLKTLKKVEQLNKYFD